MYLGSLLLRERREEEERDREEEERDRAEEGTGGREKGERGGEREGPGREGKGRGGRAPATLWHGALQCLNPALCLCVSDFKYSADVYENLTIDVSSGVASCVALGHVPP